MIKPGTPCYIFGLKCPTCAYLNGHVVTVIGNFELNGEKICETDTLTERHGLTTPYCHEENLMPIVPPDGVTDEGNKTRKPESVDA